MATFRVTTATDTVDASDGALSLREAVAAANAGGGADRIEFALALEGSRLVLTEGQLDLTADVAIDGDRDGSGTTTIDAEGRSRVLAIDGIATEARLEDLTVTGGESYAIGVPREDRKGGGIVVAGGNSLELVDSVVQDNSAGGYYVADGGGLYAGPGSAVDIERSSLLDNRGRDGAGLFAAESSLVRIEASLLDGNLATDNRVGRGGALFIEGGAARISESTISDNLAADAGGGIYGGGGEIYLVNSTVSGNATYQPRGGATSGAGIAADDLVIVGSTVTGNSTQLDPYAGPDGAGIKAASLSLSSSIVAGNYHGRFRQTGTEPDDIAADVIVSDGRNVFGSIVTGAAPSDAQAVPAARIFAAIDPVRGGGQLALNGGATPTAALADELANPALSGADPSAAVSVDQRGAPRPQPGVTNPDIGAYELAQAAVSTTPTSFNDALAGTSAGDVIQALAGNDLARGGAGDDELQGAAGADTLEGGDGDDSLAGGSGSDRLSGGTGTDRAVYASESVPASGLVIDLTAGTVVGAGSRDTLVGVEQVVGSNSTDRVLGRGGDDAYLGGGGGDDQVFGRSGDDLVLGGGGADLVVGGPGRDRVLGGAGRDRFDLDQGHTGVGAGRDLLADFRQGDDRIDLASIDASGEAAGNQAFAFIGTGPFSGTAGELRYGSTGSDTLIQGSTDADAAAELELQVTGRVALTASDFVL